LAIRTRQYAASALGDRANLSTLLRQRKARKSAPCQPDLLFFPQIRSNCLQAYATIVGKARLLINRTRANTTPAGAAQHYTPNSINTH
jgi:hypothetical protein